MSLPDGASMKRITTAVVREYALLPVTAGRAVALATVPTMMFCLSPLSRAMADDYFDPAALGLLTRSSKPPICTTSPNPAASSRGLTLSPWWLMTGELGQADITFVDDGGQLRPVLTPGQLAEYGVNVSAFPAFQALHEGETFTRIEKFIPDASSRFSFANQRLTLSIPRAAMNVQSRGYVDPSRWDDGVPAAFVDYYFSGAQIKNADEGRAAAQTISIYAAASARAHGDCATSPQCSMTSSAGTGIPRALAAARCPLAEELAADRRYLHHRRCV